VANYGADAYGAYCGHTRNVLVRIHLMNVPVICAESDRNISNSCNMK